MVFAKSFQPITHHSSTLQSFRSAWINEKLAGINVLNAKKTIFKENISVSFIVSFCLGKYCLNHDTLKYNLCVDYIYVYNGGAYVVKVIVVGNEHNDLSSNPGQGCLHFTFC